MADEVSRAEERRSLARALRQRFESLRRAGVDRIAVPLLVPLARTAPSRPAPSPSVEPALERESPREPASTLGAAPRPEPKPEVIPPPVLTMQIGSLFDTPTDESAFIPASERPAALAALAAEVAVCTRCPHLAATRTQTVFGVGSPTASLMFVGEAPGADEDHEGVPFVGKAGMLLTDMITKGMGLTRDEVYIANVLKSRPPENRNPESDEVVNCLPYLERQIEIIRPEFLCLLGKVAASSLLNTALPLSRLRGRWHRYKGIATVVTYHPAYLLRYPAEKKKTWEDLQMLMKAMGLTPPTKRGGG